MLINRLYYAVKPFVPWSVRIAIRRFFALRKRRHVGDVWPVRPGSEIPPEGWTGWPGGKQFALVLTHDVEGPDGLRKVRRLAELEMQLGFRSCFNLIPEGSYSVPDELRSWLVANGFEVGVHDLYHNGKLFISREDFQAHAIKINSYLEEWKAAGFRAGFMLRNLDWLRDLNIAYDASTFDTDPFEPQPDGVGRIYPFWVPDVQETRLGDGAVGRGPRDADRHAAGSVNARRSERRAGAGGYVELPYTLPQDSTLFFLLRERGPDVWVRKLDWVAEHGGMALINVHPDYLQFDGDPATSRTRPATSYAQLLSHVRQRHEGSFWHALPSQVASFVATRKFILPRRPLRACMVTHSFYESDNRVMRYAEALAARGDHVDVLALRRNPQVPRGEVLGGVYVHRIQIRRGKSERAKFAFLFPLIRFLGASSRWLTWSHHRDRYDLVHIHNIPDFLVFAAWYPKWTGTPIVLDIHDIVPEFFASKFSVSEASTSVRLLKWMERQSAAFADHVILANHLWLGRYAARSAPRSKCSVFINYVDAGIFHRRARVRGCGQIIIMFPGGLQWHQGLDIAIRAFQKVVPTLPTAEFHIYGEGNMKPALMRLTQELGLASAVRFFNPLGVREIAGKMAEADLGVVPKRADSFGNEAFSTKIMEFMSLGVPVVVSNTAIDRYYFENTGVRFFDSGDASALAAAMLDVLQNPSARQAMVDQGAAYAAQNSWNLRKGEYLDVVDRLCAHRIRP